MRLVFVGDIALGDHPKTVGFGFRSRYSDGIPRTFASRLLPPGPRPDFLFGNLEFPLGFEAAGARTLAELQCRGLDAYAEFLAAGGVTALNIANNHSYQHGGGAFKGTVEVLRATGIHVVGTPTDFTDRGTLQARGHRLALLGWSDRPRQYSAEAPPYNELSEDAYVEIAGAKARADVVIASIHWGEEFILLPSDRERLIARRMVEAGASVVIGHHPHVLRDVEMYGGGVIAYSLGNFICDMTWDARTRLGGWLTVDFDRGRPTAADLTPALIDDDYFPGSPDPRTRRLMQRVARAQRAQGRRVARSSYGTVAEAERRRHARLTAWMMLRHLHRYRPGLAAEVWGPPILRRIRAALGLYERPANPC